MHGQYAINAVQNTNHPGGVALLPGSSFHGFKGHEVNQLQSPKSCMEVRIEKRKRWAKKGPVFHEKF